MLLAVDCSTQWIGLALYDGTQVIGESAWQTHNHHTVEVAPAIHELMQRCQVVPDALQALGVALGPGSFTSLRIGLAVVKGLSFALHIPVVGIPTLDFLAAGQPLSHLPMAAVLQAGRTRLAVGWYQVQDGRWQSQTEAQVSTADELAKSIRKPTYICGELTESNRQTLGRKWKNVVLASPAVSARRPAYLAELAWQRWQAGESDEVISLAPIYLHIGEAIPA
jgi:tRNA threonylcarbamoyladenosine biosynthesis protein TsaB